MMVTGGDCGEGQGRDRVDAVAVRITVKLAGRRHPVDRFIHRSTGWAALPKRC